MFDPLKPRTPSARASHYVYRSPGVVTMLAVEGSDSPGYVRVYRRPPGGPVWSRPIIMADYEATDRYHLPLAPDSSD